MRLARDQQHAQLVAHTVDGDDGAVVHRSQFPLERRGLDLDDVRPGMLDVDVDACALAARKRALVDDLAVSADRNLVALAADALVVEAVVDGLGLPDDTEARRGDDRNTAVAL